MEPHSVATEPVPPPSALPSPNHKRFLILFGFIAVMAAGLLVYSQTMSFVWDEGFHLLAGQLIDRGKTPYIDFCFPQTPLNAYWIAFWLRIGNESWRITHIAATLSIAGSAYLAADFILRRFPVSRWRLAAALITACFIGLNAVMVEFGTAGQAYGIGTLLCVAAFRVTIASVRRKSKLLPFVAGLLASAAANFTLLTAPVAPILLLWQFIYDRNGTRWSKSISYLLGALISSMPVLWLFWKAPQQTLFNVVQYQALFRRVRWNGPTQHDIDVLSGWLSSSQAFLLGALAIAGLWFVIRKSHWDAVRRAEFYLCSWLAGGLTLFVAIAHPTFERYFVFALPFFATLAAPGLYWTASQLFGPMRPALPSLLLGAILALGLGRSLFDDRDAVSWGDYQKISAKVDQVMPPHGHLYADEQLYFLTQRIPPSGMEFSYSHRLSLPPAKEALFHLVSDKELAAQVKAGDYDVVETCDDDTVDNLQLPKLYTRRADVADCYIFWNKKSSAPAGFR